MTFFRQIGEKSSVKMGFHTLAIDLFFKFKNRRSLLWRLSILDAVLVWVRINKAWVSWDLWPKGYLG
jgi:hypothetical protein